MVACADSKSTPKKHHFSIRMSSPAATKYSRKGNERGWLSFGNHKSVYCHLGITKLFIVIAVLPSSFLMSKTRQIQQRLQVMAKDPYSSGYLTKTTQPFHLNEQVFKIIGNE